MMGESFQLLWESEDARIGLRTSEDGSMGIEVLYRLLPSGAVFDTGTIRAGLAKLDGLVAFGYSLLSQDWWWVIGEKVISPHEVEAESDRVLGWFVQQKR